MIGFACGLNAQRLKRRYPELSENWPSSAAFFNSNMVGLLNPKATSYWLGRLVGCAVGTKRRTAIPSMGAATLLKENDSRAA